MQARAFSRSQKRSSPEDPRDDLISAYSTWLHQIVGPVFPFAIRVLSVGSADTLSVEDSPEWNLLQLRDADSRLRGVHSLD